MSSKAIRIVRKSNQQVPSINVEESRPFKNIPDAWHIMKHVNRMTRVCRLKAKGGNFEEANIEKSFNFG